MSFKNPKTLRKFKKIPSLKGLSKTFISNARLRLAKIKQVLRNTPTLDFHYLKIALILHPHYHPKIVEEILENVQKASTSVLKMHFLSIVNSFVRNISLLLT